MKAIRACPVLDLKKKNHECASIHATIRLIKNVPDVTVFNSSGYILSQHLCALKEFHFLCS